MSYARIKCPLCSEGFIAKYNLRYHLKKDHTESEAEIFVKNVNRKTTIKTFKSVERARAYAKRVGGEVIKCQ